MRVVKKKLRIIKKKLTLSYKERHQVVVEHVPIKKSVTYKRAKLFFKKMMNNRKDYFDHQRSLLWIDEKEFSIKMIFVLQSTKGVSPWDILDVLKKAES